MADWIKIDTYYCSCNPTSGTYEVGVHYREAGDPGKAVLKKVFSLPQDRAFFLASMLRSDPTVWYNPQTGWVTSGTQPPGDARG